MSIYALALLIGVVAGLRSMTPIAVVAWAAQTRGWALGGTPLSFLAAPVTAWVFTLLAVGELVADKLPKTPSRKSPVPFIGRLVTGALSGGAIGATQNAVLIGAVCGLVGAVLGAFGGYAVRMRLAATLGRDRPAALIEDVVAVVGAILIVAAV